MLEQIVIEDWDDNIYAILPDEYTDDSKNELMTVVIWYVISISGQVSDRIICTVKVDETSL